LGEQYNIRVTRIENGYEAVIESPALRVEAQTLETVLLEIERALVTWLLDQDRKAAISA
jgi:hypothetical protein